jgi:hypothetical protein
MTMVQDAQARIRSPSLPDSYQQRRILWCASAVVDIINSNVTKPGRVISIFSLVYCVAAAAGPDLAPRVTRFTQPSRTLIKLGTETVSEDST